MLRAEQKGEFGLEKQGISLQEVSTVSLGKRETEEPEWKELQRSLTRAV